MKKSTKGSNSQNLSKEIAYLKKRLRVILSRLIKNAYRVNCCFSPTIADSIPHLLWKNIQSMRSFLAMLEEVDDRGEFPDRGAAERLRGLLEFLLSPHFMARWEGKV